MKLIEKYLMTLTFVYKKKKKKKNGIGSKGPISK